jgi:hypothetical protein
MSSGREDTLFGGRYLISDWLFSIIHLETHPLEEEKDSKSRGLGGYSFWNIGEVNALEMNTISGFGCLLWEGGVSHVWCLFSLNS